MSEEGVSDKEQIFVFTWESAFMNNEIAFSLVALIQILFWVDFENVVAHLETNWFNFWCNIVAAVLDVAESLVTGAVKIWKSSGPFLPDLFENIWWDGKL